MIRRPFSWLGQDARRIVMTKNVMLDQFCDLAVLRRLLAVENLCGSIETRGLALRQRPQQYEREILSNVVDEDSGFVRL
jgi:hypothetical protein